MICPRCFDETEVVQGRTWCCGYKTGIPVPRCLRCGGFLACDCPDGGLVDDLDLAGGESPRTRAAVSAAPPGAASPARSAL
jgi:hypothetical protein